MTREEAIKKIKKVIEESVIFEDELEAFDMAIKALSSSENPNKWIDAEVLDKIRAEIEEQKQARCFDEDDMLVYRTGLDDALYIIDKYKSESENKDDND